MSRVSPEFMEALTMLWAYGVFDKEDSPHEAAKKIMDYLRRSRSFPRIDDLRYDENVRFWKKFLKELRKLLKDEKEASKE